MYPNFVHVLAIFLFATHTFAAHLPSYIKPCRRSDENLNDCVKKHAIEALPFLLKGDKSIKLPSLQPYILPEITISPSNNLNLTFRNCVVEDWETIEIHGASLDLENRLLNLNGDLKKSTVNADYTINGRVLILPIVGSGRANITSENVKFNYTLEYELEKKNNDGKDYLKTIDSRLTVVPEVTHYNMTNLFNGDKLLGDQMNKFLNENHKEVNRDLNPAFSVIVDTIITYILNTIISNVPFDEVILP